MHQRRISDIGERKVVELFKRLFPKGEHILEAYDDAWCFRRNGHYFTVSTDMLVGRTDVPPTMTLKQAARKAIVMGASDIASKGHRPAFYFLSIGLRSDMKLGDLRQIVEGVSIGIYENGGKLVGGDTNETDDLIINVTTIGIGKNKPIPRRLGKSGDVIATTGKFGGPPSGVLTLLGKAKKPSFGWRGILESTIMPRAQVLAGVLLAEANFLSGSTDSSDGLSSSLYNMAMNSRNGVLLEEVPLLEGVKEFAFANHLDPIDLALNGGEEYHLIFSVKKKHWEDALRLARINHFELIMIGEVIDRPGVWMKDERGILSKIKPKGWQHFLRNRWISKYGAN